MLDAALTLGARPAAPKTIAARRGAMWRRVPAAAFRRCVSPLLLILVWQVASSSGLISARVLASPLQIVATSAALLQDGTLEYNLGISLLRAVAGLCIALVTGVTLALGAGLTRLGDDLIDAPMQMLRTLPALALVPMFILWFGIGETPKVALVALGATFPIYLNLSKGIRTIDPKLIEAAQTLGLTRSETIWNVILPGALPDLLVGLRFSVGIAWLMLVVAEQVNAISGVGHMMMDAQDFLRTDIILVGLMVYALFGLGSDQGVRMLERRLLVWRPLSPHLRARS